MIYTASATAGSRAATRVRVQAPQGSRYNGRTGVVAKLAGDTLFVRLDGGNAVLPFGIGEVQVVK